MNEVQVGDFNFDVGFGYMYLTGFVTITTQHGLL